MASRELFGKAIAIVLAHEGSSYVNDPSDPGGPTRFGISGRWNPGADIAELTREAAIEIYWRKYWQGNGYDRLPELVAIKTFDLAVNLGARAAISCLQRALRSCGLMVTVDGRMGPQTSGAAAAVDENTLLASIRSEAAGDYRCLVARRPSLQPFLIGWLARAYS